MDESEWSVEDQLHAEVRRLQLEVFNLENRIKSMKRKAKIKKWEFAKMARKVREQDAKANYMNMPTSVRRGKGKKRKKGFDYR